MHDFAAPLDAALDHEHCGTAGGVIGGLPDIRADDDVGRARFVFDREKNHALGRRRPLANEHDACHPHPTALRGGGGRGDAGDAARRQSRPLEDQWMRRERETAGAVVGDDFFLPRHDRKTTCILVGVVMVHEAFQERSARAACRGIASPPRPPGDAKDRARRGLLRGPGGAAPRDRASPAGPDLVAVGKGRLVGQSRSARPPLRPARRPARAQAAATVRPFGFPPRLRLLERGMPVAGVHVGRQHLHAVICGRRARAGPGHKSPSAGWPSKAAVKAAGW